MNLPNPVLAKLRRGEVSIGSWLNLASPLAAEVMAVGGCEWLVIDAEHAPWDLGMITEGLRAIESQACVPLVRPWTNDPSSFGQILDAGAMGLVAPHVSTVEQAEAIAEAVRYPPRGHRSSGTSRATIDRAWTAQANDNLIICPQIEDLEGVDNTQAIMEVDGMDVAYIGPSDLALSMGLASADMFTNGRSRRRHRQDPGGGAGRRQAGRLAGSQRGPGPPADRAGVRDDRLLERLPHPAGRAG